MKSTGYLAIVVILLAFGGGCAGLQTADPAASEFNRGLSLFNRGMYAEAAEAFVKATELDAEYGEAYLYLGRAYLSLGKWREALPPLRAAYRLAPEQARKEAGELILDLLVKHASDLDPALKMQFEEIVGGN